MFNWKKLYVVCCFLGLTIYSVPSLASVCFAPDGGCYDLNGRYIDSDLDTPSALSDCAGFNEYHEKEGEGWKCSSCAQTSGKTLYKCEKKTCTSNFDILKNQDEEPKERPGWECVFCMSGYDKYWSCPKHYCEPKYGAKKVSKSSSSFNCEDTCPHGDDTLYNCFCDDDHVERPLDGVASCVKICDKDHQEYNPVSDQCECEEDYVERDGVCVHKDFGADCQATVDGFVATTYTPLSSSDCSAQRIKLGIKKCISSTDYWAGAVKACGGIDYMPNVEELTKLAQCMYNSSSLDTSIYGRRNTAYLEVLGLSTDDHVSVWSNNQSRKNDLSIIRMFSLNESIQYWADRSGSKYYTGNGTDPADWENNSILSQTLCRRNPADPEPTESCEGCNFCIPSTCKDSGEKRIISDSSTYEKCADNCNGKYKCRSGYAPQYVGSNQYKCVSTADECSGYDLAVKPTIGNCSACSNKYKCSTETTLIDYAGTSAKACFNGCDTLNYSGCKLSSSTSKYVSKASDCPSGTTPYATGKLFTDPHFAGNPLYNMECYYCQAKTSGCDYTQPAMKITCTLKNPTTFSCSMTYQTSCCKHIGGVTFKHGSEVVKTVGLTSGSWEMPNTVINTCFFSDYASPDDGEVGTTTWNNDGQGHYGCSITLNPSQCSSGSGTSTPTCPTGYSPKTSLNSETSCGKSGAQGWKLEASSSNANCVKCAKKDCPAGSCTTGSSSGVLAGYSGNDACYQDQSCDGGSGGSSGSGGDGCEDACPSGWARGTGPGPSSSWRCDFDGNLPGDDGQGRCCCYKL